MLKVKFSYSLFSKSKFRNGTKTIFSLFTVKFKLGFSAPLSIIYVLLSKDK